MVYFDEQDKLLWRAQSSIEQAKTSLRRFNDCNASIGRLFFVVSPICIVFGLTGMLISSDIVTWSSSTIFVLFVVCSAAARRIRIAECDRLIDKASRDIKRFDQIQRGYDVCDS